VLKTNLETETTGVYVGKGTEDSDRIVAFN